jgi:two-component system sensor histidine kinase/response regulator
MDMQMPVVDGMAATRQIRLNHKDAHLPIIAMTANAMGADRDRCLASGMDDFVSKPIEPERLWRTLQTWVRARPGIGVREPSPDMVARAVEPAPEPALSDFTNALEQVADLNTKLGLLHSSGNPSLYLKLLRSFLQFHTKDDQTLQSAVLSENYALAERTAHTLKGVSGNLGALQLEVCAARMETLLHVAPHDLQDLTEALELTTQALQKLVVDLLRIPALEQNAGASQLDGLVERIAPDADEVLQQIISHMKLDDPQATDLWMANASLVVFPAGKASLIEAAIAEFDYEKALQLLGECQDTAQTKE